MSATPSGGPVTRPALALPADLEVAVRAALEGWDGADKTRRLWARDATLWTGKDEDRWMAWLGVAEEQRGALGPLAALAEEVRRERFAHALLLGMGGSSLCPEVLQRTFGPASGSPALHVLDSTDPAQVRAAERSLDPARALVIVSSKSGTTLESALLKDYFFGRLAAALGPREAGRRFIAITDPGSPLQHAAAREGFRHVFLGDPGIGGRYSALSAFGMVPAAILGLDVPTFLDRAGEMVRACARRGPAAENPGVALGVLLGALAARGRDKVTFVASPGIAPLGAWLEQLLAESTGKDGKGLIPVRGEPPGPPEAYGRDRLFAYLRLTSAPDPTQDAAVAALERAGHPVVRIALPDRGHLGQEFFRWEIATAVAGSLLGVHPFDQPDVEASKAAARAVTDAYERTGALPPEAPILRDGPLALFADEANRAALAAAARREGSPAGYLRAHLNRLGSGDYLAILAYVTLNDRHEGLLQEVRSAVRQRKGVATCLGFGPRYLHSTGQAHKGGPNTGLFLMVTCDDGEDLPVPGRRYTFGAVKAAQARGDFQVLAQRGRRLVRVHVGADVAAGLAAVRDAVRQALG